jgi:hypothetical protein
MGLVIDLRDALADTGANKKEVELDKFGRPKNSKPTKSR